jgi:hypothetical protein
MSNDTQTTTPYHTYDYVVEGQRGFSLSEALRCWHGLFEGELHRFKARVIDPFPGLQDFYEFIAEVWDTIIPFTVAEAFGEKNQEKRRIYFRAIGVKKLFTELAPELLDSQVLNLKNQRWDEKNQPYLDEIEDVYELYKIEGKKLFPEQFAEGANSWNREWMEKRSAVYAVRCWCTSTKREYWIYVPNDIGEKNDALEAIAWTIQLNITNPVALYRQGDIMIAKAGPESQECSLYHLDKKTYTKLLVSET